MYCLPSFILKKCAEGVGQYRLDNNGPIRRRTLDRVGMPAV